MIAIRKQPGNNQYEVLRNFTFLGPFPIDFARFTIPKGYTSDLASVPRLFWWLIPPHGRIANAAIIHDYLYDNGIGSELLGEKRARMIADVIFLGQMLRDGVPLWQASLCYRFVRIFGKYKTPPITPTPYE